MRRALRRTSVSVDCGAAPSSTSSAWKSSTTSRPSASESATHATQRAPTIAASAPTSPSPSMWLAVLTPKPTAIGTSVRARRVSMHRDQRAVVGRPDGAAAPVVGDEVDVGGAVLGGLVQDRRLRARVARRDDRLADRLRRLVVLLAQPRRHAVDEQSVGAGRLHQLEELGHPHRLDRVAPVGEQRDLQVRELRHDALDEREHRLAVDAVGERAIGRLADRLTVAGGVRKRHRELEAVDLCMRRGAAAARSKTSSGGSPALRNSAIPGRPAGTSVKKLDTAPVTCPIAGARRDGLALARAHPLDQVRAARRGHRLARQLRAPAASPRRRRS